MNNLIFQPVIVMCLLSFFMMIWMYATRLPAAKKLEEEHQISFENYLEEFLNKIS